MDCQYLRGKYSIVKNLPRPAVKEIDNHSYCSVKQCIADFLGKGNLPASQLPGNSKHSKYITSRAKLLYGDDLENVLIMTGVQWSDDFEPNSLSKSLRGGVWIKTITFLSNNSESNSIRDTYPISISSKHISHDVVEKKYLEELNDLCHGKNNRFYSYKLHKFVNVHFEITACLADQPERRSMNYMMLGNSTYSARFRYSCDIVSIINVLPSCDACLNNMRQNVVYEHMNQSCDKCLNWDMMKKSKLTETNPPLDYPKELLSLNGKLSPKIIDFNIMKNITRQCSRNKNLKIWSNANVSAICSVHGISKKGQENILERQSNIVSLDHYSLKSVKNEHPKDSDMIIKYSTENEDLFREWNGGPYWDGPLQLHQFIDCLMHLLFLGIVKSSSSLITEWMKETKILSSYKEHKKNMYSCVATMGLDWCKVIESESGWVSDNYLGYCKIVKWLYHPIYKLKETIYDEPTSDVKNWSLKMCNEWLREHKLDDQGRVYDLRVTISEYKSGSKKDLLANLKANSRIDRNTDVICVFIGSMLSMISIIMRSKIDTETPIAMKREIKLFLSNINIIQELLSSKKNNEKPIWLKKYNFQSLLNLPKALIQFGPLVKLWEGGNQGEGYLRYVKPRIRDVHSKNWNINAHIGLMNDISMDEVVNVHITNNSSKKVQENYNNYKKAERRERKMYTSHETVEEIFSLYRQHKPISIVMTQSNNYFAITDIQIDNFVGGVPVQLKYYTTIDSMAMNTHEVIIDCEIADTDVEQIQKKDISIYLLMLPISNDDNISNAFNNEMIYYIIDSEWNELGKCNTLQYPTSPHCLYNT